MPLNQKIAMKLREMADILEQQDANPFRVKAYRRAADTLSSLKEEVGDLLDKTGDWVVIYFYDHHHQEGQHTVVTETQGPLQGRRVVRGRENACRAHYATVA